MLLGLACAKRGVSMNIKALFKEGEGISINDTLLWVTAFNRFPVAAGRECILLGSFKPSCADRSHGGRPSELGEFQDVTQRSQGTSTGNG